jgi:CLIP-associating protein 1/2
MWDETAHISAEMEKVVEEIVKAAPQSVEVMHAVLDLLESMAASPTSPATSSSSSNTSALSPPLPAPEAHARTASFALATLGLLLTHTHKQSKSPIPPALNQRLGAVAVRYLQDADSDVRKADLDFLLVMHEADEAGFWEVLRGTGVKEGSVNLITYYVAKSRRGKA